MVDDVSCSYVWISVWWCGNVLLGMFSTRPLLHVNIHQKLSDLWCKRKSIQWFTLHLASLSWQPPHSSFLSVFCLSVVFSHFEHSKAALGGSDAVHLGWSLTCSAERKHLARDTWKHLIHWIIKTQHSPGVLYNGENYFEGKYMEREQSCSNCYQDNRNNFIFFWFVLPSWVGLVQRENQIIHEVEFL